MTKWNNGFSDLEIASIELYLALKNPSDSDRIVEAIDALSIAILELDPGLWIL
jgi:hypothetical protein